jgi:hypothetical protein
MNREWGEGYQRVDRRSQGPGETVVWRSHALMDAAWDDFLRTTPCGQFQQASAWADYKAGEGWHHHRMILTSGDAIVGGFQLLWRATRLGRIGYVSKGPVACPEAVDRIRLLEVLLEDVAAELGLRAVIVQLPDESRADAVQALGRDLIRDNPMGVIEATYVVDVRRNKEELFARMGRILRQNVRTAMKQAAMTIRVGDEQDLPRFFELMEATCVRQSTKPNPPSLDAVRRLWRAFSGTNEVRLTFADCAGATPAATLSILFGDRMSVWKKGWDGSRSDWHPTKLLEWDAIEWAHDHGYRVCDFGSFNRVAATKIIGGQPASALDLTSRDAFRIRFGGVPQLLPAAHILVPNVFYRWLYRNAFTRLARLRARQ